MRSGQADDQAFGCHQVRLFSRGTSGIDLATTHILFFILHHMQQLGEQPKDQVLVYGTDKARVQTMQSQHCNTCGCALDDGPMRQHACHSGPDNAEGQEALLFQTALKDRRHAAYQQCPHTTRPS